MTDSDFPPCGYTDAAARALRSDASRNLGGFPLSSPPKVLVRAEIRCTLTNEVRIDEHHVDAEHAEGQRFWWDEGNASCDCNRRLFFVRAGLANREHDDEEPALRERARIEGRAFDPENDSPCGDALFDVAWIEIGGRHVELTESRRVAGGAK